MTRSLRTFTGAFVAASTLAAGVTLAQSQPGSAKVQPRPASAPANTQRQAGTGAAPAANSGRQPAGNPKGVEVKPVDPQQLEAEQQRQAELRRQLEIILKNWEISSAKIKTLDGKHLRSRSNSVFATDARAEGEFHFEAPDKGRIDLKGMTLKEGSVSPKRSANGQPFALTADRNEKWICDGKQVLMIDEEEKQYETIPLPEEMRGANIIESPLPFLFGMKVAAAKQRFDMELVQYDGKQQRAHIKAVPLQAKDAQNFRRAEIFLDTEKYLPTHVSLVDPAGTITTQYIFVEVHKNNEGIVRKWKDLTEGDPFKPSLRGYKMIQPPADPVAGQNGKNAILPVKGSAPGPVIPLQKSAGSPRPGNGAEVVIPRNGTATGKTANGVRPATK